MGKSLKQMRQSKTSALPTRTVEMCLAQHLVAEVEQLVEERDTLEVSTQRRVDDAKKPSGPPSKLSAGSDPRIAEIDARLAELHEEMNEHTGTLTLRGEGFGPWRRWADEHPARTHDPANTAADPQLIAGARLDREVTYGFCDAAALLDRLEDFAVAWDGEDLEGDDWETITTRAAGGDLKEACRQVVEMHEGAGMRAPKSPRPSAATSSPSTD